MIVREIMQDPDNIMATFDYFNDYKDTRSHVLWKIEEGKQARDAKLEADARTILARLDLGYVVFHKGFSRRHK